MKILQSCGSASWGGLEILALKISIMLKQRGHEIHLICPANSALENNALKHDIKAIPLWKRERSVIKPAMNLKKLISSEEYNIVHTHLSHDLWTIVPALKLSHSSAKLILSKHMGSGVNKNDVFHKYLYRRVNQIIAVSGYVKQRVIDTCPIDESKVSILYPGLNLDDYNPADYNKTEIRREFGIEGQKIVIGMAGRMSPGKGHEEFLEAAKVLKDTYGDFLKFMVVGSASYGEDNYEREIHELASSLNINDVVLFTGYRNDIPRIMAALDIFVFPSHEESFGIALTEAMAMECPVIASASAAVPEIVINNKTGLLVPPRDPLRLAEAITTLVEDKKLRESMGKAGRKRALEIFNSKDELDKLEGYYAG